MLLTTILKAYSHLHGILFDQPQVVEGALSIIASEGLTLRCEVAGGDFFQAVPPGGDAYILKSVIHDWDDEHSIMILKNCRRAMTKEARLLLVETVVPATSEPHYAKYNDLEALVLLGSQERTLEEYATLFKQARFELVGVVPTEGPLSIVEALPV